MTRYWEASQWHKTMQETREEVDTGRRSNSHSSFQTKIFIYFGCRCTLARTPWDVKSKIGQSIIRIEIHNVIFTTNSLHEERWKYLANAKILEWGRFSIWRIMRGFRHQTLSSNYLWRTIMQSRLTLIWVDLIQNEIFKTVTSSIVWSRRK